MGLELGLGSKIPPGQFFTVFQVRIRARARVRVENAARTIVRSVSGKGCWLVMTVVEVNNNRALGLAPQTCSDVTGINILSIGHDV